MYPLGGYVEKNIILYVCDIEKTILLVEKRVEIIIHGCALTGESLVHALDLTCIEVKSQKNLTRGGETIYCI